MFKINNNPKDWYFCWILDHLFFLTKFSPQIHIQFITSKHSIKFLYRRVYKQLVYFKKWFEKYLKVFAASFIFCLMCM